MKLCVALVLAAPILIDISGNVEVKVRGDRAAVPAEVGAILRPTDVLIAGAPCTATVLYDAHGAGSLTFATGRLALPVGDKPGQALGLAGTVGTSLAGAFSVPPLPVTSGVAPDPGATLQGDPSLPGLPGMDELSRWRLRAGVPSGAPGGPAWGAQFDVLDDAKYGKVIGLASKLTAPDAPPGARLALARWLESRGLVYAALFEYRVALRSRLVKGKVPAAYRVIARHVAALALALGDRGTARAISCAVN